MANLQVVVVINAMIHHRPREYGRMGGKRKNEGYKRKATKKDSMIIVVGPGDDSG